MMLYNRVSNAQQLQRRVAVSAPFLRPLTCHAAAEATPEASTTSVKVNEVYSGKVTKLSPVMASVSLDNEVPASLHISMISNERVAAIGEVFAVGDELKVGTALACWQAICSSARRRQHAVVVSTSKRGIQLSTKALELVPGQMKTDKQGQASTMRMSPLCLLRGGREGHGQYKVEGVRWSAWRKKRD
ncbi:uncharacterized protein HaLaN_24677 [Haematococcus lacustris]|uniref:S1 motif domain-containing protein n=1 Tax=Haematococcus lacustris TaxID=44745 RepID=A0A699ZUZ8_HAELA|nr:uncharacterized protein HaLaN_24677 [Haematococcus lacustris]